MSANWYKGIRSIFVYDDGVSAASSGVQETKDTAINKKEEILNIFFNMVLIVNNCPRLKIL
jgi:sulfur relay (sulfurtransferase) complex TusBCD TusD component (DsrE family)